MSEKRDAEYFINKFITAVKADLNTQIAAINTAKGDSLLDAVNSNAYYYLTFGQKVPSYDPAVVFGVKAELAGDVHSKATETLFIATEMVISAGAELNPITVMQRIQRYRRALLEVIGANYRSFPSLEYDVIPDVGFSDGRAFYYALGVLVKMTYPM